MEKENTRTVVLREKAPGIVVSGLRLEQGSRLGSPPTILLMLSQGVK